MIGTTLEELRARIEQLASESGRYYLACARHGDRPVPASGLRFENRVVARAAARATERYRAALRRYDPRLPHYDVIVRQDAVSDPGRHVECVPSDRSPEAWTLSEPVLDGSARDRRPLVEFCHRVAASVFETLSERGHEAVESAVVDAYLGLAEELTDPDDLCLCLLESTAAELDRELTPSEQAAVLTEAAGRLPPVEPTDRPVPATLSALEDRGLLGGYTRSSQSVDSDGEARSVVVHLSEYALSARDDRLPVLPIALELHRHRPDGYPPSLEVVSEEGEWRLTVRLSQKAAPSGLANAPIR